MTQRGFAPAEEAAMLRDIEAALSARMPLPTERYAHDKIPSPLAEAMRYSLLAGGKRIRPLLLLRTVEMLGGDLAEAMPAACALEMIHTYSLIHDDLPGMDDDDLRRGRPTNHRVYGVGMAILAGDGLLNAAYEWMLNNALRYPMHLKRHLAAAAEIARRAGVTGMIAGQCMDVLGEGGAEGGEPLLRYIHRHKTADLLTAPLAAGAQLSGADAEDVRALERFGQCVGLAFQIVDDLLDVVGDVATLGKTTGVDAERGKLTWPALLGIDAAREEAQRLTREARLALGRFDERAVALLDLADRLTIREA